MYLILYVQTEKEDNQKVYVIEFAVLSGRVSFISTAGNKSTESALPNVIGCIIEHTGDTTFAFQNSARGSCSQWKRCAQSIFEGDNED